MQVITYFKQVSKTLINSINIILVLHRNFIPNNNPSCHDLAKQLSYYLYFFSFLFSFWTYYLRIESVEKYHTTKVIGHMSQSQHMMSHKVVT